MKKRFSSAFLIAIMVCGFALVGTVHFGTATASTDVIGIIDSDTTWTKANSPYTLTGPVAVNTGVTLTIEAGTTVNLNSYYIQVNGTLAAKGSGTDLISFNNGQIIFTQAGSDWNEQTSSGSIIENAIFNSEIAVSGFARLTSKIIINNSPKINRNTINAYLEVNEGSPTISYNNLTNKYYGDYLSANDFMVLSMRGGSPKVFNNTITGISITGGSPVILNNKITRGANSGSLAAINNYGGSPVISSNSIESGTYTWSGGSFYPGGSTVFGGIIAGNNAHISDNIISGCSFGIKADSGTIEKNLIFNNTGAGIEIKNGIIQNNTITGNGIGIKLIQSSLITIKHNNFEQSAQNTIYLEATSNNIEVTNNWWGTTDKQAISQTIYDFKNDFNLGKVTFEPFLTAPNPQAMPDPNVPMQVPNSSPSPSPNQSPSPDQNGTTDQTDQSGNQNEAQGFNEIEIAILAVLIMIAVSLIVLIGLVLKKRR